MKFTMGLRGRVLCSALCVAATALCLGPASFASETRTYSYDALGRLVKVAHGGTVNSNTNGCYAYDKADNRTNVTVSTTGNCASAPSVSFSVNDVSATEGGNLVFTITKSGSASVTTGVTYSLDDGTATLGKDYDFSAQAQTGVLTFSRSATTHVVTVHTIDDTNAENPETLNLNLSAPTGGAAIGDGQGVGTINDDDGGTGCSGVSFRIASNGAVTEGSNSLFTVTKTGSTASSCEVNYATANGLAGGATAPADYTSTSGLLKFTSAQTSKAVSVPTADDTTMEPPETFTMSLSGPNSGGTLGSPSSAAATINDNDGCRGVTFTIASNGAVTEGSSSNFTVTKSGAAGGSCSINYATANGTAVAPGDYTSKSGTLTFDVLQTTEVISVATIADGIAESSETFSATLSAPTNGGALGTPGSATATITDGGIANQNPTPVNDMATVKTCGDRVVDVVANDTDPDGNYPLSLVSVTSGNFSIFSSTQIEYSASNFPGTEVGTYTVQDSLGAVATATLTVTVTAGGTCNLSVSPAPADSSGTASDAPPPDPTTSTPE